MAQACSRAPGTDESWARVDRKMLWSPAASSDRQRRRVLARVKARRYAPPPLRGAGNLDAGSAHALRLAPCLTMPNHDPYMLWSTTCPVSVSPKRPLTRLHEKGGKRHDVPAHHRAAEALDDYLEAAGLDEAKAALFQSVDPAGRRLTGRALSRRLVLAMIKRRICRPRPAATRSGRRGSRRICRTGGRSSTRSRSPGTRRRRRRSSTTGRRTRSPSTRSSAS